MQRKRLYILGWWSQPGFRALTITGGQAAIVTFNNSCLFSGIIVPDETGLIRAESVIWDKNGPAEITGGEIDQNSGKIWFPKKYVNRQDVICYNAVKNRGTGCWIGNFAGQMVGQGTTRFVISDKFPTEVFEHAPLGNDLAEFIDKHRATLPSDFFEESEVATK